MKRLFFVLLLPAFVACSSGPKLKKPFYFVAHEPKRTIHFLGTMHLGYALNDLPPEIQKELENADVLAVEVDDVNLRYVAKVQGEKLREYAKSHFKDHYPKLKSKLSPLAWENLSFTLARPDVREYVRSLGVNWPMEEIHPYVVLGLTGHFASQKAFWAFSPNLTSQSTQWNNRAFDFETAGKLDHEVIAEARKKHIEVIGLDKNPLELSKYHGTLEDKAIAAVEEIYGDPRRKNVLLMAMKDAYENGDEKAVLELSKETDHENLLYRRNKEWFKVLSTRSEKDIFVAVGAAHLVGPKNLLELFSKNGARIERVTFEEKHR